MKLQTKKQEGFTIIEVMIVLVIAAVILLIVFLAVPALQRNSRNTQRKNDASRLLAATTEWRTNNKNAWPPNCLLGCSGAAETNRQNIYNLAGTLNSFPYASFVTYDQTTGISGDLAATGSGVGDLIRGNINASLVLGQAKCDGVVLSAGSGVVVIYGVESGGSGVTVQCING